MKLSDIRPNPNNPRVIRDERFAKLKNSIEQFPKMMRLRPIVVDASGVILGGNMRLRALQDLGYKEIPDEWVKRADDLTEEEKQRFIIADNVGFGEWEWETLANEWDAGDLEAWGLDVPEFDDEKQGTQEDDYEMPETGLDTDIVLGDLFEIGAHRLLCGDSTDSEAVAKLMNGEKADMVFTDPDFSMDIDLLKVVYANMLIFSSGFGFWVCGNKQAVLLAAHDFENFSKFFVQDFRQATIIANNQPMTRHVMIVQFGKRPMNNLHDAFSTLLQISTERTGKDHKVTPMAKKVELPAAFIEHFTQNGELVIDCFLHSGTTIVAAEQLGRRCYGIEINPRYCQCIIERVIKSFPDMEIKKNGNIYLHK